MPSSSTILIKRRKTGDAGKPSVLRNGELAYNEVNDVLYYGRGVDAQLNATEIVPIGGRDVYTITYPVETPLSLIGGESTDFFAIPFNMKVVAWTLLSETAGSVRLDIQACTYDNYPTTNSICNGHLPFIEQDTKNRCVDVHDWDEYLSGDGILKVTALSADVIDRVTLILKCERY
jgi:hypothetical protein